MSEAETLFGAEAATAPEFMRELEVSLRQTPLHAEQLMMFQETEDEADAVPHGEKEKRPRRSSPMPVAPPPEHLRVEIWRESKKGQRSVRVIQL